MSLAPPFSASPAIQFHAFAAMAFSFSSRMDHRAHCVSLLVRERAISLDHLGRDAGHILNLERRQFAAPQFDDPAASEAVEGRFNFNPVVLASIAVSLA